MHLFAREFGDPHDYSAALEEWLGGTGVLARAVARNLIHDHRVTVARADQFDRFVERPCSGAVFAEALTAYQQKQVRTATPPDFAVDSLNGNNLLSGTSTGGHFISKDYRLVRVLDLNLLTEPYKWAKTKKWDAFLSFNGAKLATVSEWLKMKLEHPRQFVEQVLTMLAAYQQQVHVFHPTWVTSWEAFAPYIALGPDRWNQVVGVERPAGHWLILLAYRVRDVGSFARPTQLDAGWYAYHFPSPPQAIVSTGGHPVDLDNMEGVPLLPEFIHQQIPHTIEHWDDAGSRYGVTTGAGAFDVAGARLHHHHRLLAAYGQDVAEWMPKPT